MVHDGQMDRQTDRQMDRQTDGQKKWHIEVGAAPENIIMDEINFSKNFLQYYSRATLTSQDFVAIF